MTRILAVDPGDARIGLALSDPTGLIARPLLVLKHTNRTNDALRILGYANEHQVDLILVGIPLDQDGYVGHQARKNLRLVEAIQQRTTLEVRTWDESGTTQRALDTDPGKEMLDARAAAFLLQDYLDATA